MKKIRALSFVLIIALIFSLSLTLASCDEDGKSGDKAEQGTGMSFGIKKDGKTLSLGESEEKLLSVLGEPKTQEQAGACGSLGTIYRYNYTSATVDVLKTDKDATVDYISLSDDLITTDKGIRIGSSRDEAVKAYGAPTSETEGQIKYVSGNNSLLLTINGGKVSGITFLRSTEN